MHTALLPIGTEDDGLVETIIWITFVFFDYPQPATGTNYVSGAVLDGVFVVTPGAFDVSETGHFCSLLSLAKHHAKQIADDDEHERRHDRPHCADPCMFSSL